MPLSDLNLPPIGQIGIVVRDIRSAVDHYSRVLGINGWTIKENSAPPLDCTYRGRPASYRVAVALGQMGSLVVELIQYLEGDTIHRDFAETRGEGVEHLGIYVSNLEETISELSRAGVEVLQRASGLGYSRDGGYAYLDTEGTLGTILELIQPPTQRNPPAAETVR